MNVKNFLSAVAQIAEENNVPKEKVIEGIEKALGSAYKKDYGKKGQIIKAELDEKTGEMKFWQVKEVVTEDMIYTEEELEEMRTGEGRGKEDKEKVRFNPRRHIMLKEAREQNPDIESGQDFRIELEPKQEFGRIAAQTAKQVIIQQVREAQKETTYQEYKQKEGEIISGVVQRKSRGKVYFDIGKTLGVLPPKEQIPQEQYEVGQRFRLYILKVEQDPKGPVIFLSRAYPKMVSKLFEIEVPEISSGQVKIKSIAREVGSRTKIAVSSEDERVDPIGAVVGERGTRVMAVKNELRGEKIDVVQWSEDPKEFIANALAPAKVLQVKLFSQNRAKVLVPEDQLSLAIGKEGQNVRLGARLTGWKLDIESPAAESPAAGVADNS